MKVYTFRTYVGMKFTKVSLICHMKYLTSVAVKKEN